MATFKPFKAVKPAKGLENSIASLPYDVFNRSEATEFVKDKPLSFLRIDRAETNFDDSVNTYDEIVYKTAKDLYEKMKKDGSFVKDDEESYYLYEEIMNGRSQTGIVGVFDAREYETDIIKKHENTRKEKEIDRINHVDSLNAQTGPIFLAYRNKESLMNIFNTIKQENPVFDFVSEDGITHRGWKISDKDILFKIENEFSLIPNLYIADGHHRCASAVKVSNLRRNKDINTKKNAEYNYVLSVAFPDTELMIMDYNRVVKTLNKNTEESLLSKLSDIFDIEEKVYDETKPSKKGEIFMLLKDKEYILNVKPQFMSCDPVEGLDVEILQKYVLNPIFGIIDPKTDKNIDFVGGIRGIKELKRRIDTDAVVCFAMYPTKMSELFSVADVNKLMPPKSTWFEPKLRSGLFIHELD